MKLPPELLATIQAGQTRIAVTGARGWFGQVSLALLEEVLGPEQFAARVIAFTSDGGPALSAKAVIPTMTFERLADYLDEPTLVLHYAFRTKDQEREPDFVSDNIQIITTVLGAFETGNVAGLFAVSSGAAKGEGGRAVTDVVAHPYGALKHLEELAYEAACWRHEIPLVIARTYSVAGPYMTKRHLYALGDLVDQVSRGEAVKIRARGRVTRSYAGVRDIVALALAVLHDRSASFPLSFESAGEPIEMGDLAKRVCQALGREEVPILREFNPSLPANDYLGEGQSYRELLAHYAIDPTPLSDLIQEVAGSSA